MKKFTVIANNCWGGEVYRLMNQEYNTPFIGLFLFGPDFLKLLEDFDNLITKPIRFTNESKWMTSKPTYPVGLIDDIEIHFLHYKDENEALDKWSKRLERMLELEDKDNYYFKICDRDLSSDEVLNKFHLLPFKNKISFGLNSIENNKNHIIISERENNSVPDGVKLFHVTNNYVDLEKWITTGTLIKNN